MLDSLAPSLGQTGCKVGCGLLGMAQLEILCAAFCLQIANEVNSRRINDELNVFEGLHKSHIFIGVLLITAGLQVGELRAHYGIH